MKSPRGDLRSGLLLCGFWKPLGPRPPTRRILAVTCPRAPEPLASSGVCPRAPSRRASRYSMPGGAPARGALRTRGDRDAWLRLERDRGRQGCAPLIPPRADVRRVPEGSAGL